MIDDEAAMSSMFCAAFLFVLRSLGGDVAREEAMA
jgi:hypothetical protein